MDPKTYVLLPGIDYLIAVCKDDEPGFWLERYDRLASFSYDHPTPRAQLGQPTHVSDRLFIGADSGQRWLMDTFLGDGGLLNDQNQNWLIEQCADIETAMHSLQDVQVT